MAEFKSSYKAISPILGEIEITAPGSFVASEFNKAYQKLAQTVKLKGFRPGKAPRPVLERHYKHQIEHEVQEACFNEGFQQSLQGGVFFPVSQPKLKGDAHNHPKSGEDYNFVLEVEIKPEVEVKDWENLPVTSVTYKLDDEAVQKRLEEMQNRQSSIVPVENRDVVQQDDVVECQAEVTVDGARADNLSNEAAVYHVGGGSAFPAVEQALVGKKIGEELIVSQVIPEDYANNDLRGKEASFALKISQIKMIHKPALDDEFAKDVGDNFDTLDALKADIREKLAAEKEQRESEEKKNSAIDALIEANTIEVPPALVNRQAQEMAANYLSRMVDPKQFRNIWESVGKKFSEDSKPQAKKLLQASMLCEALAKSQGIEVVDADVDAEFEKEAKRLNTTSEKLRTRYREEDIDGMKYRLRSDKVVDLVISKAKVTVEEKSLA